MSRMTKLAQENLNLVMREIVGKRARMSRMSRMAELAQEDSTISEFATTPRFRGFHSANRGQLLASSAMDLGDQT